MNKNKTPIDKRNQKSFDENGLRNSLGMVGIITDDYFCYILLEIINSLQSLGGKFSLKDACKVKEAADIKFP